MRNPDFDPTSPAIDPRGRVALVTGGNRGIGQEVCRQLARLGHTVWLTARNLPDAERAAGAMAATGLDVRPLRLDVRDAGTLEQAAHHVGEEFGRLDVLVNNAAIHYDSWQRPSAARMSIVTEAFETNLFGAWRTVLAFVDLLRAAEHPRIVNVSSEAASLTNMGSGAPAYTASKTALNALTRMLAADLRHEGVLVNSVCPGWVATDMGGPGGRPVEAGAASVVWAALLADDGPTGDFFRDGRALPW